MRRPDRMALGICGALLAASSVSCGGRIEGHEDVEPTGTTEGALSTTLRNNQDFPNPTGKSASFSKDGDVDLAGAFFQSLGTNGRSCGTCHLPGDGWTVSARSAREMFDATGGTHELFAFDGQNCVGADRSTVAARRAASSLMIDRAVVRFNRAVPPGAEFEVAAAEGTYCNVTDAANIVVYRRPLPTTNFGALGTVAWDGFGNAIAPTPHDAIGAITVGATQLHAQTGAFPSPEQITEIVDLMESLTTAQTFDQLAGNLAAKQALGGPENLAALSLTDPPGFTVYDAWQNAPGGGTEAARLSVARGQAIFDTRPISITGVGGLTDRVGTCAGCHRVSNMGNTAGFLVLNIGTSDEARRPADLPLYTLRNLSTGQTVKTNDPGRAMVTGAWADIGKFKVPNLRALAARAPYFHAGTAGTLDGVVGFYNGRFSMGMSAQEKTDLANFLRSL